MGAVMQRHVQTRRVFHRILYAAIFVAALTAAAFPLWSNVDTAPMEIGGAPVVTLTRPQAKHIRKPQFVEATVLPGEGMNVISN